MKITRITIWGILLAFSFVFAGCTGTVVTFNTMPEQPYDATRGREIKGGSCGFQLFTFIPIMINDRAQRAYDQLVASAGGEYVTDIKVNERWSYAFVGTVYCTEMQAMAFPKVASAVAPRTPETETKTGTETKTKTKKFSSIDECIDSCKKDTGRTDLECFEACKR